MRRFALPLSLLALLAGCSASPDGGGGGGGGGPDAGGGGGGEVDAGGDPGGPPDEVLWSYPYVLQVVFAPAVAPDGTIVVHGKHTIDTPE
ncbi:MAG TPA: hypothetical protein VKZ63_21100, partial [Kofleriaceae bacterium]|nr:hypothetical protein [Kofleriaceae bacterium]